MPGRPAESSRDGGAATAVSVALNDVAINPGAGAGEDFAVQRVDGDGRARRWKRGVGLKLKCDLKRTGGALRHQF